MKKIWPIGMLLLLFANIALAQPSPLQGDWLGTLRVQSMSLRMVFHVTRAPDGSWGATMDSPDQGANGLAVDTVTVDGMNLRLTSSLVRGEYVGVMQAGDSVIEGAWKQSGMSFPLRLSRIHTEVTVNRPQVPRPPYPYLREEVTFRNDEDGVTLAGTLTLPRGDGPFPAVALVSGSGPQDRDETVFNHKPFAVIADHLGRQDIAVLRYDDRGVGNSTGDFGTATSEDFARDAEAAASFLLARKEIDGNHVGLIGHSEGGIIAPMVAARSEDIAFIVMLAGPSVDGKEIILAQDSLISAVNGVPPETIARSMETNRRVFSTVASAKETATMSKELRTIMTEAARENPDTSLSDEMLSARIERTIAQLTSPWFRFFLVYDPYPTLTKVTCPVLALNGEKDLQVPSRMNLDGITRALAEGNNTQGTVKELPGLNHLFQTSATGSPTEYATIEETFSPLALSVITDWITSVTSKDGR